MSLISRAPMRAVSLPRSALAFCTGEAFTTVPHRSDPQGEITTSIWPFRQRPSSGLLAEARPGDASTAMAAIAARNLFMFIGLAGICGSNGAKSLHPHERVRGYSAPGNG